MSELFQLLRLIAQQSAETLSPNCGCGVMVTRQRQSSPIGSIPIICSKNKELHKKLTSVNSSFGRAIVFGTICSWFDSSFMHHKTAFYLALCFSLCDVRFMGSLTLFTIRQRCAQKKQKPPCTRYLIGSTPIHRTIMQSCHSRLTSETIHNCLLSVVQEQV